MATKEEWTFLMADAVMPLTMAVLVVADDLQRYRTGLAGARETINEHQ